MDCWFEETTRGRSCSLKMVGVDIQYTHHRTCSFLKSLNLLSICYPIPVEYAPFSQTAMAHFTSNPLNFSIVPNRCCLSEERVTMSSAVILRFSN